MGIWVFWKFLGVGDAAIKITDVFGTIKEKLRKVYFLKKWITVEWWKVLIREFLSDGKLWKFEISESFFLIFGGAAIKIIDVVGSLERSWERLILWKMNDSGVGKKLILGSFSVVVNWWEMSFLKVVGCWWCRNKENWCWMFCREVEKHWFCEKINGCGVGRNFIWEVFQWWINWLECEFSEKCWSVGDGGMKIFAVFVKLLVRCGNMMILWTMNDRKVGKMLSFGVFFSGSGGKHVVVWVFWIFWVLWCEPLSGISDNKCNASHCQVFRITSVIQ